MIIKVNTLTKDDIRQAKYDGNYTLVKDKGDTMIIKVDDEEMLENKVNELEKVIDTLLGGESLD